ncbi:MAG: Smr/MutS family protein [Desulfococcaceae bacterium]|nr:Smr/MutS family protein [Desulfococcaceae bacterium]
MEEIIRIPITDVLDLHTFQPKEIPELLEDYFSECIASGIFSLRIIHGKGKGILKKGVCSLLDRHPLVASWSPAPGNAGGWGAVLVELKKESGTCPNQ